MNAHVTVGTPLLDMYGKRGFIAEIKAAPARTFTFSGGMRPASAEYVCIFENRVSELIDGIAAPFIERAKLANLPHVPESDIPARMAAARAFQADQRSAAERARQEEAQARAEFEADATKRIPTWAKAVIVGELIKDDSDTMTDYFNSKTTRRVILAFSKHTRDIFSEMRAAARNHPDTVFLADAPESAEHREKYSMGGGYYLKNGYRHNDGWKISKVKFYGDAPARYVPTGEWSLAPVAALASLRTKADIHSLMRSNIDRSNAGYYDAGIDTNRPAVDSDQARALWALIDGTSDSDMKAETLRQKVDALQFANIPGYFPTPLPVIESMIFNADMPTGEFELLEPEGGSGAILDVMRQRFKGARLTTYERHASLREVLSLKGYAVAGPDFMAIEPRGQFDRVMMNPPFENGQDIEHVRHAFECLKPGGRLVAIMSTGPFYRQDRKASAFREWFEAQRGERHELPAASFKASGTGVATVLVVIEREV